jgi:hypothetical protein
MQAACSRRQRPSATCSWRRSSAMCRPARRCCGAASRRVAAPPRGSASGSSRPAGGAAARGAAARAQGSRRRRCRQWMPSLQQFAPRCGLAGSQVLSAHTFSNADIGLTRVMVCWQQCSMYRICGALWLQGGSQGYVRSWTMVDSSVFLYAIGGNRSATGCCMLADLQCAQHSPYSAERSITSDGPPSLAITSDEPPSLANAPRARYQVCFSFCLKVVWQHRAAAQEQRHLHRGRLVGRAVVAKVFRPRLPGVPL